MATGRLAPLAHLQPVNAVGVPYALAKRYWYSGGTSTPITVYQDRDLTTPHASPQVADAAGRFAAVYLDPALDYKEVVQDASGTEIWSQDHLALGDMAFAVISSSIDYTVVPTDGSNVLILVNAAGGNRTVGLYTAVGYGGRQIIVKKVDASTNTVTVDASGAQTIDGALTVVLSTQWAFASLVSDDTNWSLVSTQSFMAQDRRCEGRLTLTSGTPVTSSDVTAATTIYFTPYRGNIIGLFNGSDWIGTTFAETSLALTGLAVDTNYDVFAYLSGATLTLEAVAWSNSGAGTGARATALTLQDGEYVKTGATTKRYLGTFRTTGTIGQTEDSEAKRFVWNYYHRRARPMKVLESADNWTYTTATWRQKNNAPANQVAFVVGLAEDVVWGRHIATSYEAAGGDRYVGIGYDAVAAPVTGSTVGNAAGATRLQGVAEYRLVPAVGYHYLAALERGGGSGTVTWYGDNGDNTLVQDGILGEVHG